MKKLLVAALMVLLASPAFAAIQNVKVSGDINSAYLNRDNFNLGIANGSGEEGLTSQNGFMTQTRVRVDADLSDNVSATVRLINERAWGTPSNSSSGADGVDLDLAYVTLREFLYSPLTVTVGRQEFFFGNGLIIGGGPNNVTSGQFSGVANDLTEIAAADGIKAVLDYKPLTLTMIYFKNQQNLASLRGIYNSVEESSDVYGMNANYQLGDAMNTVLEAYMFSEINGSNIDNGLTGTVSSTGNPHKGDKLYVPGLRASTNPVKGLNVQGEVAWQLGNKVVNVGQIGVSAPEASENRDAMALQLMANYSLPVLEKFKPAVSASYTYVSGDKDGGTTYGTADNSKSTKTYSAWDPMFEGQGGGTIYNAIFGLSNMSIYTLGASACPLEDVSASFTWSSLWAAQKYNGNNLLYLYQPNDPNATIGNLTTQTRNKSELGNEYDINLGYAYTEDVSFGLNLGWFVAGNVFTDANRGTASQAIANVKVAF